MVPADDPPLDPLASATPGASITQLLAGMRAGDDGAQRELFGRAYDELRRLARSHRRKWSGNETMNTTALVHEAFLKLAGNEASGFQNRTHFFATASMAMRQVLVNYAEHRRAAKCGGGALHEELDEEALVADDALDELLDLDKAMRELDGRNPRAARVVECRVFGGLSVEETAEALEISPATVKREWQLASALLYRAVSPRGE